MRLNPKIQARYLFASLAAALPAAATDWPQFGYDGTHSGSNTAETSITAANVALLIPLYAAPATLAATVDSAPVYKAGVMVNGTPKNLLFFLSNNGRVMAIDAATGTSVWSHTTTGNQPATASPAIDPNGQFVYSYGIDGKAHKYKIDDGTETTTGGWPQTITLKTNVEKGASGFTIANSGGTQYLVVVTDGYIGDGGNYQGHLVSINLTTGTQNVFNTLCSTLTTHLGTGDCTSAQSGIWGRGGATFVAATGRVYIATGNGQYNANTGGHNWSDSVLALNVDGTGSGSGMPMDSYTPTNFQSLQDSDTDLGSISLAVLPVPSGSTVAHLGMQVGKDAKLRLIDLDDMSGQGGPAHIGGELQLLNVPQGGGGMREQPAVWVNPIDSSTWLFVGNGSGISGLKLGLNGSNLPQLSSQWNKSTASTSPILANGVLYSASSCTGGKCIVARNPLTGDVLWTSPNINGIHWQSPILVDGAIYMTDNSSKLWKFGLNQPADLIFANGFDG
ncbi:MAG: PQQ-binding-like beta-propeller repeat protein [Dokdonella sp.]